MIVKKNVYGRENGGENMLCVCSKKILSCWSWNLGAESVKMNSHQRLEFLGTPIREALMN